MYSLKGIAAHKEEYSLSYKPRNFLRSNKEYISFLISLFGERCRGQLNYLIDGDLGACKKCGVETDFINHDKGYKEYCKECANKNKSHKISNKAIGRKIHGLCPRCELNETVNGSICDICISLRKCINCQDNKKEEEISDYFGKYTVCWDCSLDYLLKSKFRKYSPVNFYKFKKCDVCDDLFAYMAGGVYNANCKEHRKKCEVCSAYFNKQGVTCSNSCATILTQQTNLNKFGEIINLNVRGMKPSHSEYWLQLGYSISDSLFKVYQSQSRNSREFKSKDDVYLFFEENLHIIEKYDIEISKRVLFNSLVLGSLLDCYIEQNNIVTGSVRTLSKEQTFGTIHYVKYKGEVIVLRSNKEFYFFTLLEKYDIMFTSNQKYPDSDMYFDFYLPEYDTYIEITGFMGDVEYRNKMSLKQSLYGSVLLDNFREMREFIETKVIK